VNIKGIIFDKDGTLFNFQSSWGPWFYDFLYKLCQNDTNKIKRIANEIQFDATNKIFLSDSQFIAGTLDETIQIIQNNAPNLTKQFIEKVVEECLTNLVQEPVTDLSELFGTLKAKNYKIGLVTNDQEKSTKIQLERANIISFFDFIAGCDSGYGYKPSPKPINAFCNETNISSCQTIMVGDSIHDLVAANAANAQSIGVLTGVALKSDLRPYTKNILGSIKDLTKWLENNRR
jgi:phosphoglycolate phosphatase